MDIAKEQHWLSTMYFLANDIFHIRCFLCSFPYNDINQGASTRGSYHEVSVRKWCFRSSSAEGRQSGSLKWRKGRGDQSCFNHKIISRKKSGKKLRRNHMLSRLFLRIRPNNATRKPTSWDTCWQSLGQLMRNPHWVVALLKNHFQWQRWLPWEACQTWQ